MAAASGKRSIWQMLSESFGSRTRTECRVLVVGLDNSGKTSVINKINPGKEATNEVTPTVGLQVEEFAKGNLNFTVYDMSGQSRYRDLWSRYYRDTQAIIFVVDSTDRIRMCVAKDELWTLLQDNDIRHRDIPILFFANKMDLSGAMDPVDITDSLELPDIENKSWQIQSSNALTGDGIEEGIEWLAGSVRSNSRRK
mmetsp:Transcript_29145/g.34346  ORF Transcript_29145/g.34346 Transcript_29145/m.34346 type:complete len:197 (+) Transcript_29145:17-607(+)|eukprot:CAMPEP_0114403728 /NCGR_PEP_ID=MMETSP0102-20121206/19060_1 /TAXON_ID=38822 ORGANISM="Pteridomonas danica, Strain PT" /NCGR_SAMPLE_ID=MMETSP0102 /ASSEMBLY_ACC=CAM_ASM_000212 /LENGTH=196 /DNA_ID=CAMNT_0001568141 /DNA_START=17 /DNA_END=607 /DNA_ORIENTATION=-